MVSILSFESRSIQYLLQEKFNSFFTSDFPMFYKNKIMKSSKHRKDDKKPNKYFFRSAIDNALRNNQIGAIEVILDYIVENQNVYHSSFLFNKNLGDILKKGIKIKKLLDSKVYNYEFEFDEWPNSHTNNESFLKPYNLSIFELRNNYRAIFPEPELEPLDTRPIKTI